MYTFRNDTRNPFRTPWYWVLLLLVLLLGLSTMQ